VFSPLSQNGIFRKGQGITYSNRNLKIPDSSSGVKLSQISCLNTTSNYMDALKCCFDKLLQEIKNIDNLNFLENDDIDYVSLLKISQFSKTYNKCDCKERFKNEIHQEYLKRCELCYKDYIVRKVYYALKNNKMLNWCDVTYQDLNFDGNYKPIYDVLSFKAKKHYSDVGLKNDDPNKYNKLAQNIIAKCIYEYYLYQTLNNIFVDCCGRQVFFYGKEKVIGVSKVIVRMFGFSTKGNSKIRRNILEPSIITFY
jgi:hypothetical protein